MVTRYANSHPNRVIEAGMFVRFADYEKLDERIAELEGEVEQLRTHVDTAKGQASNGDYEHGMANGLIWALHIMEGSEGMPHYVSGDQMEGKRLEDRELEDFNKNVLDTGGGEGKQFEAPAIFTNCKVLGKPPDGYLRRLIRAALSKLGTGGGDAN